MNGILHHLITKHGAFDTSSYPFYKFSDSMLVKNMSPEQLFQTHLRLHKNTTPDGWLPHPNPTVPHTYNGIDSVYNKKHSHKWIHA